MKYWNTLLIKNIMPQWHFDTSAKAIALQIQQLILIKLHNSGFLDIVMLTLSLISLFFLSLLVLFAIWS